MRPDDRLPRKRTLSSGSLRATRRHQHAQPAQRRLGDVRSEQLLDPCGDLLGLDHASEADLALGQLATGGADHVDTSRSERRDVGLRRGMLPHARVHGGRDEDGPTVGQGGLGQQVVGQTVCHPRQRVRRERRHDEQVRVRQVRIRIGRALAPGEREERLGRDESLGARGRHREHVVPGADEQPNELARLVRRDTAGDPEHDARHGDIVPGRRRPGRRRGLVGA